jgi:hypothetical protein
LIGLLIILPMLGAQLGVNLNLLSHLIGITAAAIIERHNPLTANLKAALVLILRFPVGHLLVSAKCRPGHTGGLTAGRVAQTPLLPPHQQNAHQHCVSRCTS